MNRHEVFKCTGFVNCIPVFEWVNSASKHVNADTIDGLILHDLFDHLHDFKYLGGTYAEIFALGVRCTRGRVSISTLLSVNRNLLTLPAKANHFSTNFTDIEQEAWALIKSNSVKVLSQSDDFKTATLRFANHLNVPNLKLDLLSNAFDRGLLIGYQTYYDTNVELTSRYNMQQVIAEFKDTVVADISRPDTHTTQDGVLHESYPHSVLQKAKYSNVNIGDVFDIKITDDSISVICIDEAMYYA